ncbi:MAG: two-component system sensor histidine kinase NtrB [Myxococcota bacterium]
MGDVRSGFAGRVLGSLASGIVGVDANGAVVLVNAGAKRLLGCPEGSLHDALGRDCRQVFASEPAVARLLLKAARGQQEVSRAELALRGGARGEGGTIGLTLFPVRGPDGARCGAAMLFRDLTPIERSAEQERLQGRLAALGQMAAGLAHELRNPLASMEVLAGLLRRRLSDEEDRQLVDDLLGQMRDLSRIITTSLDFVRPAAPRPVPTDPVALVEGALGRVLPRPGAAVRVERAFEPAPAVPVDEEQMTVALSNLMGNAVDAMQANVPAERRLRLGVCCVEEPGDRGDKPRREVCIAVGDSGPGIPPELRDRIFYPFFTTRERGSGIGLATVQKVVASHGGRVELDTRVGHGTTFTVRLPLDPPEMEPS